MDAFVEKTLAFLERCDQHQSIESLAKDFSETIAAFGFNYFMMTRLPAIGESAEPYVIAHSWPKEWLDRYRAKNYFWHDPVSAYSMTQGRPFSWQEARDGSARTRMALKLASEAKGLGLRDGIGFPMGDPSSVQAVVSLASDQLVALDAVRRGLLHSVCLNAEIRAVELHDRLKKALGRLSPREREVLRWIANGKNSWETSQILSVSEATIAAHLGHARAKLRAVSTPQAIARAMRDRQLIL